MANWLYLPLSIQQLIAQILQHFCKSKMNAKLDFKIKKAKTGMVAHACNFSDEESGRQKDWKGD